MFHSLTSEEKKSLYHLQAKLKAAVGRIRVEEAEATLRSVQRLFGTRVDDQRLLVCKLQYFECLLDANHPETAESGFVGIRRKAQPSSLLYIEATFLEGISLLRRKQIDLAKDRFKESFQKLSRVSYQATRQRHEKRMIDRLEQEAIIAEAIGAYSGELNPDRLHEEAVNLIQSKSEDEILELMGSHLPSKSVQLLLHLRGEAILQLPPNDRKALPDSAQAASPLNLGGRVAAFVRRIGWKTICDPDSPIYLVWSSKLPEMFSVGFFTKALSAAFTEWKIQIPILVSGIAAIAMKYTAQDFCERARPESVMEIRGISNKSKKE